MNIENAGVTQATQGDGSLVLAELTQENRPLVLAENLFKPDVYDFLFALFAFVLGYMFSRWVLFAWQGWGVAVFTTAYLLTVSGYLMKKDHFTGNGAAWFWMFVTWATGASYALWGNAGFNGYRSLLLFSSAVYFVITASGRTIMGKTGNFLLLDGLNAVFLIPLRNLFNQYVSFSLLAKGEKRGKVLPAFLGVVLAVLLAAILIPMLERADSGGFGLITGFFRNIFRFNLSEFLLYAFFAIPAAAYIYGLASGSAFGKGTDVIKPEGAQKAVEAIRLFQPATVYVTLGAVCAIYLVFILSQIPYFFSAFTGSRPEGWLVYSEYARHGFFELCSIATINLVVLALGNVTSKKLRMESRVLKLFNVAIAVITLVLIATAFSKMALYIGAYGLTMPRLLPCVFMVFLAIVFIAVIVLQKRDFSIVRFALVTGTAMLCMLCLLNPDALVVRYNADRYIGGTLTEFDMEVLYRAGAAGVIPAIEVYEKTRDEMLQNNITFYLRSQSGAGGGGIRLSLESYLVRERLAGLPDELDKVTQATQGDGSLVLAELTQENRPLVLPPVRSPR